MFQQLGNLEMINLDNVPFTKVTMAVDYLELIETQFIIQ